MTLPSWRQRFPHFPLSPERSTRVVSVPGAPRKRVAEDSTSRSVSRRLNFHHGPPRSFIEISDDDMVEETDPGAKSYISKMVNNAISNAVSNVVNDLKEEVSTFFQCAVCNFDSISVIPLVMPCGRHTVCFGCAHQMVKSTREWSDEERQFTYILTCPQCRESEECCNRLELFDTDKQIKIDDKMLDMCKKAKRIETGKVDDQYYIESAACPFGCGEQSADHEHAMFCGRGILEGYFRAPRSVTGEVRRQGQGITAMIQSIAINPILHYENLSENVTTLMESIYYRFNTLRYLSQDALRSNERSLNVQLLRDLEIFNSGIAVAHESLNSVTGSPQRRDVLAHLGRLQHYRHLSTRNFVRYHVDPLIQQEFGADFEPYLWLD